MTASTAADACACSDFHTSRRKFLAGLGATAGGALVTGLVGDAFSQVALGATAANPNVLVVLSLRGGADGLSLVVPHGDPSYAKIRRSIGIPTQSLLAKDNSFGLHPGFKPLEPLWGAGKMAAINAVGMPTPNRSHFSAMEVVEDADPGSSERRGWINRVVGLSDAAPTQAAVQMGGSLVPTSLYGPAPVLGLNNLTDLVLPGSPNEVDANRMALQRVWGEAPGSLAQGARATLAVTRELKTRGETQPRPLNNARYPTGDLGDALSNAATMIRAQVGAQVITIDYGSWDMHTKLGTLTYGPMQSMVTELGSALAAFFTDLGAVGDTVTLATVSEFGRRVEENGEGGLDHGYGNCMLLLGGGVNGGKYHGRWPGLGNLVEGDLAVNLDHRSVFAEILRTRMPEVSLPVSSPASIPSRSVRCAADTASRSAPPPHAPPVTGFPGPPGKPHCPWVATHGQ
ncbi:MAG: DUF1501 domain-containing protein [Actinomycetota bacterium]|nr:DUF1501 domain-containing protein [Actinomycetota bacterium]